MCQGKWVDNFPLHINTQTRCGEASFNWTSSSCPTWCQAQTVDTGAAIGEITIMRIKAFCRSDDWPSITETAQIYRLFISIRLPRHVEWVFIDGGNIFPTGYLRLWYCIGSDNDPMLSYWMRNFFKKKKTIIFLVSLPVTIFIWNLRKSLTGSNF